MLRRRWFGDWPKHNFKHKDRLPSCIQLVKAAPVGTPRAETWGSLKFQSNSMRIISCENLSKQKISRKCIPKYNTDYCVFTSYQTSLETALDECSPVWHLL